MSGGLASPPPPPSSSSSDGRSLPGKPPSPSPKPWQQVAREGSRLFRSTRVSTEEILKLRGLFKDKLSISKSEIAEASKPWRCALIGHFLGRQRDTDFVARTLSHQWRTFGDVEVIPMSEGFFTFRFACEEDTMKVWTGGPWSVGGMVLSLEEWRPCFRPSREVVPKAAVWVRLPQLPIELMTRDWVLNIVSRAGTPIDIDISTKNLSRGSFARACIEINLSQPLVPGVSVEVEGEGEFWQQLVYEKIGIFCFQCGRIGHRRPACSFPPASPTDIAHIDGAVSGPPSVSPLLAATSAPAPAVSAPTTLPPVADTFGPWLTVPTHRPARRKLPPSPASRHPAKQGAVSAHGHTGGLC